MNNMTATTIARFEIVAGDIDSPSHLQSRSIPNALEGRIKYETFQEFADRLDKWLKKLDFERHHRRDRCCWRFYNYFLLVVIFVWSRMVVVCLAALIFNVCISLCSSYWITSPTEMYIKQIRSLCEAMTNQTPNVSFHPIFHQELVCCCLPAPTLIHIDVCVLENGLAVVMADAVGNSTPQVTSDYQQLEMI